MHCRDQSHALMFSRPCQNNAEPGYSFGWKPSSLGRFSFSSTPASTRFFLQPLLVPLSLVISFRCDDGLTNPSCSIVRCQRICTVAFKSQFRYLCTFCTHFMPRRSLRSTPHFSFSSFLRFVSVHALQQRLLRVASCSDMSTVPDSPRSALLHVNIPLITRYVPMTGTKSSSRCAPSFPCWVPYPMVTGFFWVMPSASIPSAAHASAHSLIR